MNSTLSPQGSSSTPENDIGEIVVTAQKRAENIDKVGMSISAISGNELVQLGITDTSELTRVVPGFSFNQTAFATPVYTIRGVGFQEASLGASPTVSVYVDEMPIPFPAESLGAPFDLDHVEVLKGPQGTLYGENSTGGAINYIAAKPTNTMQAGTDISYGRFNTVDLQGFVSGPLMDALNARLAIRTVHSDDWQYSYTRLDAVGMKDLLQGRLTLDWLPVAGLKVSVSLNGWNDQSDTQEPQLVAVLSQGAAPLPPGLLAATPAPANNRAADWDPGVSFRRNNSFYQSSARIDYGLSENLTVTSLTTYERYKRDQPVDGDGTPYQDNLVFNTGAISTVYQELRIAGKLNDHGNWILGANFESDEIHDKYVQFVGQSSANPTFGLPLDDAASFSDQDVKTYAGFANLDYSFTDSLSFQAGARFTQSNRRFSGCDLDAGDGQFAAVIDLIQAAIKGPTNIVPAQAGGCVTLNSVTISPGVVTGTLDQNNVSWRTGLNWTIAPETLIYGNVSKGFKAGNFPTLSATSSAQLAPVTQESILAYEIGAKSKPVRNLQFDAAAFYYDYNDKQIRGRVPDAVFGPLEALVNIPRSHILGAEFGAKWIAIEGLVISPAFSFVRSRIDGQFVSYTPLGTMENFSGEAFPYTPKWQASMDAEYSWRVSEAYAAFGGANISYQSATNGALGNLALLKIDDYALLDLRAGIKSNSGTWRFMVWGRNVTDKYYWTTADKQFDTAFRLSGAPAAFGVSASYRFQ